MKFPRRQFLHLAAGAVAVPAVSRIARAQAYPSRPVRLIVATVPGSPPDINARIIGDWLSARLGQAVVIDNRPGAGGNLGAEAAVRATADGHTLLLVSTVLAINATLYQNVSYDITRDVTAISPMSREFGILVVHPSVPAKSIPEFIQYATDNPGKLTMASGGNGTPAHVAGELFKMLSSTDMLHVPYRGAAPALTDLIGGQVQVMFATVSASIEHARSGKLRALGVTAAARKPALPDIPAISEFLSGYEASSFFGLAAPKGLSDAIVERLNREVNAGVSEAKIISRFAELGIEPFLGSSEQFRALIAAEKEKWAKVIKFAGIKPV